DSTSQTGMNRRKFLAGVGAGAAASVAGCTGDGGADETPTPKVETVVKTETVVQEETVKVTESPTPTPQSGSGKTSSLKFNAMGYTGADEFINKQKKMMSAEKRQPVVKKVLAQIWNDAPTNVNFYSKLLHVLNNKWEGWIPTTGGPVHNWSNLNVKKADGSSGGKPVIGMDTAPDTLNVLATSTAYSFQILDNIYQYGTATHPDTLAFIPGVYKDWTLNVENVGTDKPTMTATIRDGVTFSDGTPVTAEDAKFSVDYIVNQETAGSIASTQFSSLAGYKDKKVAGNGVTVDDPKGNKVSYFLTEKDNAWFTAILGQIFLPKHIWKDVSNYQKYTPRDTSEGIVGSGPFTLSDFNWQNWFELSPREDSAIWETSAYDFIDSDGPFIDQLRYEIFGSQTALQQALLDRTIDAARSGVQVEKAVEAQRQDGVRVVQSEDTGWSHMSFNTRRVPFDDRAFRQFLIRMLDDKWIIDDLKKGVGGRDGTYVTPFAYQNWRPPEPSEIDSHEGIKTPNLPFPGSAGSFQLSSDQISAIRKWLVAHKDAKHDYSWAKADVEAVASADGKVLHVNGDPLTVAHTDNFGQSDQGPLEVSFNPPQEDVDESRIMQRFTGALKQVGVPANPQIQSFNSQIPKVYGNENFDIFAMGWVGIGVNNDHYGQLFGGEGADLGY
ncbi:MAG: ABC transporter substrate-binding protein, partial [Halobacteriales archaeon]